MTVCTFSTYIYRSEVVKLLTRNIKELKIKVRLSGTGIVIKKVSLFHNEKNPAIIEHFHGIHLC